jgi:hypothetical protein
MATTIGGGSHIGFPIETKTYSVKDYQKNIPTNGFEK